MYSETLYCCLFGLPPISLSIRGCVQTVYQNTCVVCVLQTIRSELLDSILPFHTFMVQHPSGGSLTASVLQVHLVLKMNNAQRRNTIKYVL